MRPSYSLLSSFWSFLLYVLKRPWGSGSLAVILVVLWLSGFPLIRLSYSTVIFPLRCAQYFLSLQRADAIKLDKLTGFGKGRGAVQTYLERLALWSVIRALRQEHLSLQKQAIALAIVRQESGFRFYVKNPSSTACGLFQLISASGAQRDLPWWRCMDPLENSRAGTAFFREISANRTTQFESSLRCSYLRHYYGPAHSCSNDPQNIWGKTQANLTRWAQVYLQALSRLETERAKESFFKRTWERIVQYLPTVVFALLAILLLVRVVRPPGTANNHTLRT